MFLGQLSALFKALTLGLVASFISVTACLAGEVAHSLTVSEGFADPLGFYDATPTLSWKLPEGVKRQTAYQIEVKGEGVSWESGWVESAQSVQIPYQGEPLSSRAKVFWRMNYRDEDGAESGWSETASLEMGLLSAKDWQAQWIRPAQKFNAEREPTSWLRKDFSARKQVQKARLYVTAKGLFEISLNGKKVGSDAFTPGWTAYADRIDTLTYDVTDEILKGDNTMGAMLGTGWYAGRIIWKHDKKRKGRSPELLLQLEIEYTDGSSQRVVSDPSWKATLDGPILTSSLYDGETYDARKEMKGWSEAGFDHSAWEGVEAEPNLGEALLVPKPFATTRVTEEMAAVTVTEPSPGKYVFDMGQNMVGWIRLSLNGQSDETITMRFAEMLNPDGTIYTENYRSAKSTNNYTPARSGHFTWQPTFTFHGFRYVELSGLPKGRTPGLGAVTGLVLHTRMAQIGRFDSSHDKLNRLQSNIVWGQRGNFLDIPTDCPQRDERLGWTGDAQAFCATAMFNYDCHAFFKSWLSSMRDDQFEDGQIPHIIPDALVKAGSPGWMDAATLMPWDIYLRTGDVEMLSDNFAMMEKLVGWYRKRAKGGVIPEIGGFGDWLQPHTKNKRGDTDRHLLGSAFYANSVRILANSAGVLGKKDLEKRYREEAEQVKAAYGRRYFDGSGVLQKTKQTQTAYILSLHFNLIPEEQVAPAESHLLKLIDDAGKHLRTGFLGTPYLALVLDQAGEAGTAYELLFQESYPSWFFSINQGATTLWERWDSYTHEKGFHPQQMNSFNHYAYGAIGQWMYERVAGLSLDPAHPGYKHFFVRPVIGGPLTSASAELETPYGRASSAWGLKGDSLTIRVQVPPNTTATLEFPNGRANESLDPGQHQFTVQM